MVLEDDYSIEQGMNLRNTVVVSVDPRRVQYCLPNSICPTEYTKKNEEWHQKHLVELGNYIMDLLDKAVDVPKYLAANKSQFTPPNLLGEMS